MSFLARGMRLGNYRPEGQKVTGRLGSNVAASHMRPIFYLIPGLGDTRLGVAGKWALQ